MPWTRPRRSVQPSIFGDALRGHFLACKDWLSRLWWVVRSPHDSTREFDIYVLRCEARDYVRYYFVPFERCRDCRAWTRRWWKYKTCGGEDCSLPF